MKTTEEVETRETVRGQKLRVLEELEKKVLWLSTWMVHNANLVREKADGLKVGGHQASSASATTILTALYFDLLRPEDRVAVKPHASPAFHAIQYLLGHQSREKLERFRAYQGAQAYPSRTKDGDPVDFSTGSMGLGLAQTCFASLVQDYVRIKGWREEGSPDGRMIAVGGDAELDEGNVYEALYECWKHGLRKVWWIVDYNRQSLDAVATDRIFGQITHLFQSMDWRVLTLKYGKKLQRAFARPGGPSLRQWIDDCPNSLYSALVFKGGAAWRQQILSDLKGESELEDLLGEYDDQELHSLMTNLGGHDLEVLSEAFHRLADDGPTCIIAYTIKGYRLPLAGHKENHAGLMSAAQMDEFRRRNGIDEGMEWDQFTGLDLPAEELEAFLRQVPFSQKRTRRWTAPKLPVPQEAHPVLPRAPVSTQQEFGRILLDLARQGGPLVDHIVTLSPDVTISTNLGGWVNRRGVFHRDPVEDRFKELEVTSLQKWEMSPRGQHIELGIAENNLFLMLAALGLSHELFGVRLIPIGTLYDPFIYRGLDALNYACYQDARFILVATPSGITLAPEGGAHQSLGTPLLGIAQDGLAAFEPAFADELAVILPWAFEYIQRDGRKGPTSGWLRDEQGGSVYLRLSTRPIAQPQREMTDSLRQAILEGGYWLRPPASGGKLALVTSGAVAPEAQEAFEQLVQDFPDAGLLAVTSADRLNAGWQAAQRTRRRHGEPAPSRIETLLEPLASDAALVTVIDGHPAALSWIGGVRGHRVQSLGVEHFGQSGNIPDLYRHHGLDAETILNALVSAWVHRP
ncbi:MAG: transketolase [Planctomycetes bacterium]|nr:transketolase [Planctomycetota bacterium]